MQISRRIKVAAIFLAITTPGSEASSFAPGVIDSGSVVSATVTRVGSAFQITWTTTGDVSTVKIKEGTTPEQIENQGADVAGGTSATISGLDLTQRHYFRVKGGSGDGVIAAERGVPQVGVLNFRDTGGYSTVPINGNHVKNVGWGLFFRSGGPGLQSNQAFLTVLGVKTVIDGGAPTQITAPD